MKQPAHASFWSRLKIASLIRLLLVLMVFAGIFFTSVFLYLKSQLQQVVDQQLAEQPGLVLDPTLQHLLSSLDFFILAVFF